MDEVHCSFSGYSTSPLFPKSTQKILGSVIEEHIAGGAGLQHLMASPDVIKHVDVAHCTFSGLSTKLLLPLFKQKDVTSEIEAQVAEFPAGAQQVEASARTSHVTFLQDNVAAPYAKPFAPWLTQNVAGLVIDVQKAGGAGKERQRNKKREKEKERDIYQVAMLDNEKRAYKIHGNKSVSRKR